MDMSPFDRSLDADPAPRVDFAMLVALLGAARDRADPAPETAATDDGGDDLPPLRCLIAVVLGQRGWRRAALALGGRFAIPQTRQPL